MSLFHSEVGASQRRNGNSFSKNRHVQLDHRILHCGHCPLDKIQLLHPKIKPTGSEDPLLYFIGEAPGKTEDEVGEQFIGSAGNLLRDRIPIQFSDLIRWNNVLRCRPPDNRDPDGIEIECCRKLQVEDIERTKPPIIVGFGLHALTWFLGHDRPLYAWRGRRVPIKIGNHVCWFYPIEHPASILRKMHDKKLGDAILKTFERDLERVFSDVLAYVHVVGKEVEEPKIETDFMRGVYCLTEYGSEGLNLVEEVLSDMGNTDHGVDIETDRLRPYHPDSRILSVAVSDYEHTFSFAWEHPQARWNESERKKLSGFIHDYLLGKGRKWAHKASFEQEWFNHRFGPSVLYMTQWGDTLGQAHIIDERPAKELDELTQLWFGFRIKSLSNIDVTKLASTDLSEVLPYNGLDAKYCFKLGVAQADKLESMGLTSTYELMNSATPSFVTMQWKGVVRNMSAIRQLDDNLTKQRNDLLLKLMNNSDVISFRNRYGKFNPSSNPDLQKFFRDHLKIDHPSHWKDKESNYSVDEESLSQFSHPVAVQVVELRTIVKNRGYVEPLLDGGKYVHGDGLVHASYGQYVTVSGRSACSEPNEQNYPRREHKEIRRVVGVPPGHKGVSFDYGQLEARIVAAIAKDLNLCEEIRNNEDIHGLWTDKIGKAFFYSKLKANRKKVRDGMKSVWTFSNIYGNSIEAIAHDLSKEYEANVTVDALRPYYDEFWKRYSGIRLWQKQLEANYWEQGWVATATGQRRHEPMKKNEWGNHPIQGTAGHLVINAQDRISRIAFEQNRPQLFPIMNIHDDLSFYLPDSTIEQDIEDIARVMCCTPFEFITVPLSVEVSLWNGNWCDKEEIHTFTTNDFKRDCT